MERKGAIGQGSFDRDPIEIRKQILMITGKHQAQLLFIIIFFCSREAISPPAQLKKKTYYITLSYCGPPPALRVFAAAKLTQGYVLEKADPRGLLDGCVKDV